MDEREDEPANEKRERDGLGNAAKGVSDHRGVAALALVDVEPADQVGQSLAAEAEPAGGLRAIAGRGLQSFSYEASTEVLHALMVPGARLPGALRQVEMLGIERYAVREGDGDLEDIAQLAHVARPVIRLERGARVSRQTRRARRALAGEEVVRELEKVPPTLP